ncbi:efflux RND transporter periplasmic adaptor subunit [Saccharophagus degradans]|uniref:Secretion protein HlyD n=1 Tax=Saccharophagus degradans (strain 2-40 / ATCC 43961 / DSM 17024) TaxID=203122 RepID=Q21G26_SACD2|nr:efflux RND transporter periplasmic adaptor subunit [Saccharophagus degradans]ABD82353.1 secretion protein HlyD [Saccharophagus degradans 2-40]
MSVTKQQIFRPIAVLLGGAAVFTLIMFTKSSDDKREEEKLVPYVSVEKVELAPIQLVAHSQGEVRSRYQTRIVSEVSGKVQAVSPAFENGGLVKKGELLAQIDPFDYEVKVQQAKANLASARAAFIQERAQGRVAEAEWASITNAEPSELGLRKPQQEQALASVKAAEAAYTQAQKDLERTQILAPFDALVKSRDVSPGTFLNIGGTLGELLDVSLAEVRLPVNQSDFSILQNAGRNAQVVLRGHVYGQTQTWQARIVRDEGMVDAASRMIYLVAHIIDPYALNNATPRLPFGTYVSAEIHGELLPQALKIPRRIFINGAIPVVADHKLELREVTVLKEEGKHSIVSAGLADGDLMVVSTLAAPIAGMELTWEGAPTPKSEEATEKAIASAADVKEVK